MRTCAEPCMWPAGCKRHACVADLHRLAPVQRFHSRIALADAGAHQRLALAAAPVLHRAAARVVAMRMRITARATGFGRGRCRIAGPRQYSPMGSHHARGHVMPVHPSASAASATRRDWLTDRAVARPRPFLLRRAGSCIRFSNAAASCAAPCRAVRASSAGRPGS